MQTLHIAELIDKTIQEVIFDKWKHEGYMDGWNNNQVATVIDGKRFIIDIKEEENK